MSLGGIMWEHTIILPVKHMAYSLAEHNILHIYQL